MLNDITKARIKKIEGFPYEYVPDVEEEGKYSLLNEFKRDISRGLEIIFAWNKHSYMAWHTNDKKYALVETYVEEDNYQEYDSINELLEKGTLTTGEKLKDVILLVEVEEICVQAR